MGQETGKEHVQQILRKRGGSDRTQAGVWAVRKGLVERLISAEWNRRFVRQVSKEFTVGHFT